MGSTDYTYHPDVQGSTRGITAGGAVTDAVLYDAFGNTISRSGSTPTPVLYNGATGYQSDSATGLQLLGHRYYDPNIGRFLSSDPAQAGTNWYAYCDNNPLVGCDPTGLVNPTTRDRPVKLKLKQVPPPKTATPKPITIGTPSSNSGNSKISITVSDKNGVITISVGVSWPIGGGSQKPIPYPNGNIWYPPGYSQPIITPPGGKMGTGPNGGIIVIPPSSPKKGNHTKK